MFINETPEDLLQLVGCTIGYGLHTKTINPIVYSSIDCPDYKTYNYLLTTAEPLKWLLQRSDHVFSHEKRFTPVIDRLSPNSKPWV